jgi:dienelactone hydrolase
MRRAVMMVLGMVALGGAGPAFPEMRARPATAGEFAPVTPLGGTETCQTWEKRRAELRREWEQIIGPLPAERTPLNVEEVSREELADHTRVLVRYAVDPKTRTEAFLLLPKGADAKSPRPAMVCLHPTSPATIRTVVGLEGREQVHYALQLVRRGYVCIAPRSFLWEVDGQTWQQAADRVIASGWKTGMSRMTFDAIRATDVLIERPEVDKMRIGTIGHSLGGKEALYHAAFDERIVAAISCEGGVGLKRSNWEADWYLGKQIKSPAFHHDNQEVMALVAPRALLVIGGESADGARSWPFVEACLPAWRLYDAEDRLGLLRHAAKHNFPSAGATRERVWEWLDAQVNWNRR